MISKVLALVLALLNSSVSQQVSQLQCESYSLDKHTQLENILKEREVQCVPLDLTTEMSGDEIDELAREFSFVNIVDDHTNRLKAGYKKLIENNLIINNLTFDEFLELWFEDQCKKCVKKQTPGLNDANMIEEKVDEILYSRTFFLLGLDGIPNIEKL